MPAARTRTRAAGRDVSAAQQTTLLQFVSHVGFKRPHPSVPAEGREAEQRARRRVAMDMSAPSLERGATPCGASGTTASTPSATAATAPTAAATAGQPSMRTEGKSTEASISGMGCGRRDSRDTNSDGARESDDDLVLGDLLGLAPRMRATALFPSPLAPSASLTQTFLDLGQPMSLHLGRQCPRCGMLFTPHREDEALHRRHCKALSRRSLASAAAPSSDATRHSPSTDGGPQDLLHPGESLAQSAEAVRILETLLKHARKPHAAHPPPHSAGAAAAACEKVVEAVRPQTPSGSSPPPSSAAAGSAAYILRCAHAAVRQSSDAVRLLEAFGFFDAVLQAAAYTVVVVASEPLGQVLAAVAGCPSTREQDPQLVVERDGDGRTWCGHTKVFTRCDVNYLHMAPLPTFVRVAQAARRGAALALTARRDAVRNFFAPSASADARQREERRLALGERTAALRTALAVLSRAVVYGHQLSPESDFSFSSTLLAETPQRIREAEGVDCAHVPAALLALSARASGAAEEDRTIDPTVDSRVGLYIHGDDNDESGSTDDDDGDGYRRREKEEGGESIASACGRTKSDERIDQLSVVSYED